MGGDPSQRRRIPKPAGIGRIRGGSDVCDVAFTVDLIGVRRAATDGVKQGDALGVGLEAGASGTAAICRTADGTVVGGLAAFEGLSTLLRCLAMGARYRAMVERVGATHCTVTVTRVRA